MPVRPLRLLSALCLLALLGGCISRIEPAATPAGQTASPRPTVQSGATPAPDAQITPDAQPTATPTPAGTEPPAPAETPAAEPTAAPGGAEYLSGTAESGPSEQTQRLFTEVLNSQAETLTFSFLSTADIGYGMEEVVLTLVRDGDDYVADVLSDSDRMTLIQKGDMVYAVLYSLQAYTCYAGDDARLQFEEMMQALGSISLESYKFSRGTVRYRDELFTYERLTDESGRRDLYYDASGALRYLAEPDRGIYMEIYAASNIAAADFFEIPADFVLVQ